MAKFGLIEHNFVVGLGLNVTHKIRNSFNSQRVMFVFISI